MTLKDFKNIPFPLSALRDVYPSIASISNKAIELEKAGAIIRLKRGLYVVSPTESGLLLSKGLIANHIYGPSYVSLESALRLYGLIPERIEPTLSMTIKHTRDFENTVGRYEYIKCSRDYFPIGISIEHDSGYMIATPEKALCDFLVTTPTSDIRSVKTTYTFLNENLRFDMDALKDFNQDILRQCAAISKKKNIILDLIKVIQQL